MMAVLALTGGLISRGYPLPYTDDLVVTGAALNMARDGEFENPYVREWLAAFPTDKPFYYPPGMSFMLAGWLMAFGTSVGSMLAFQWTSLICGAAFLTWFLRRWCSQDLGISVVGGLTFLLAFQLEGFRNEVTAYALTFLGLCLCFYPSRLLKFTGYFLIAFSGVAYPLAPLIAIPLYLAIHLERRLQGPSCSISCWKTFLAELPYAAVGFCVAFSIFLWMIKGDLGEFVRVLRINKEASIPGGLAEQVKDFWYINTAYNQKLIRLPVLAASVIALVYSAIFGVRRNNQAWVIPTALAFCCIFSILTHPMRAKTVAPIFEIILVMIALGQSSRKWGTPAAIVGLLFCALINMKVLIGAAIQSPVDPKEVLRVRSALSGLDYSKTKVIIDHWAARYIYRYNIPPEVTDLNMWGSTPKIHKKGPPRMLEPSSKPANEVWVLGTEDSRFSVTPAQRGQIPPPQRASVFGMKLKNIPYRQTEFMVFE